MVEVDPTGTDWTEREIDLIVADYFDMLRLELAGQTFVKRQRNAALQELTKRSRGSIEFKHQNISAVLERLGRPWIRGYLPLANFQRALVEGVERYLDTVPSAFSGIDNPAESERLAAMEAPTIFLEPPPDLSMRDANENPALERLVRKFDPAERDARNRALGKRGEERIFHWEKERLKSAGRADLTRKVRWISEEEGDGAGYDILSFDPSGKERLLEVKTTVGGKETPFFLSENERSFSAERPDAFRLVRLFDFVQVPRAFELVPPLEESVLLRPTNYRASFHS